jgi:hypothetical protein
VTARPRTRGIRYHRAMRTASFVVIGALAWSAALSAQWLNHPTAGIPRTKDGKPNLSAPAPKLRDGRPDLSGVWRPDLDPNIKGTNDEILPRFFISITGDFNLFALPFTPEAAAAFKERLTRNGKDDPTSYCHPLGLPAVNTAPVPFKIVQTPGLIVILYEGDTTFRQIFMDGRKLPDDPMPSWLGSSIGRWDKDTLVVETVGLNESSWLDRAGHAHSDALRVTERFRRRDFGHMDIQMTLDDPKTYTKPIVYTQPQTYLPDTDLLEYFCTDNEVDTAHFK